MFANRTPRRSPRTARLGLETLEGRDVPAATVYLDFTGIAPVHVRDLSRAMTIDEGMAASGALDAPDGAKSFVAEFAALQTQYGGYAAFHWLDLDADGRL